MESYNAFLEKHFCEQSVDLFGVADLSPIAAEDRSGYPYGISFGLKIDPKIVVNIVSGPHQEYYDAYVDLNRRLTEICESTTETIRSEGYDSFPMTKKNVKQDENWTTKLPLKTVAVLAGLGWIGKSAIFVTDKFGSALRLSAVLTNMPLLTAEPRFVDHCQSCDRCVRACPAQAIRGNKWSPQIQRDDLLDPRLCKENAIQRGKTLGIQEASCGLCIAVCPYTKKYLESRKTA
jgi:epoxyqueuosine reductase QueG